MLASSCRLWIRLAVLGCVAAFALAAVPPEVLVAVDKDGHFRQNYTELFQRTGTRAPSYNESNKCAVLLTTSHADPSPGTSRPFTAETPLPRTPCLSPTGRSPTAHPLLLSTPQPHKGPPRCRLLCAPRVARQWPGGHGHPVRPAHPLAQLLPHHAHAEPRPLHPSRRHPRRPARGSGSRRLPAVALPLAEPVHRCPAGHRAPTRRPPRSREEFVHAHLLLARTTQPPHTCADSTRFASLLLFPALAPLRVSGRGPRRSLQRRCEGFLSSRLRPSSWGYTPAVPHTRRRITHQFHTVRSLGYRRGHSHRAYPATQVIRTGCGRKWWRRLPA